MKLKTKKQSELKRLGVYACLILTILTSLMPLKVFALDDFYSLNDILFYDKNASNCQEVGSGATTDTNQNLETILKYLTGKGFSLAVASGIAGNLFRESAYNPAIIQGGKTATDGYTLVSGVGFGIAQWTTYDRQKSLMAFAASEGKSIIDINMQLDFLWQEIHYSTLKTMLNRLSGISSTATYGSASAPMASAIIFHGQTKNSGTVPQEIIDVDPPVGFERSGDTPQGIVNNRGLKAEEIFNTYKGKIADGTGVADASAEILPNANDCSNTAAGEYGWDLEGTNAMVFYDQSSSEWKDKPFGIGTIGACGCGPTSLAMIVATLTGDTSVNPENMAAFYAANGGQAGGGNCGSSWNWQVIESKYDVTVTDIGTDITKAKESLSSGNLVLFSWSGAPFTSGGHIMVLRKYDDQGNLYIASSGGTTNYKQSQMPWSESIFINGYSSSDGEFANRGSTGYLKGMWSIEKL